MITSKVPTLLGDSPACQFLCGDGFTCLASHQVIIIIIIMVVIIIVIMIIMIIIIVIVTIIIRCVITITTAPHIQQEMEERMKRSKEFITKVIRT